MNLRVVGLSQNWFGDSPFNKGVIRLGGKHTNLTAGTRNAKHCATACGGSCGGCRRSGIPGGKTMRHLFDFDGGKELTTMSATWFVSYAYYTFIDNTHRNWERVETYPSRKSVFERTQQYHRYWLERVLEMDNGRLNTNKIEVEAERTKEMARELLKVVKGK
jgi:hypothetical protein